MGATTAGATQVPTGLGDSGGAPGVGLPRAGTGAVAAGGAGRRGAGRQQGQAEHRDPRARRLRIARLGSPGSSPRRNAGETQGRLASGITRWRTRIYPLVIAAINFCKNRRVRGDPGGAGLRPDGRQARGQRPPPTRKGAKKAQPVALTPDQAARLKAQPDTPQGRRDALLLCLLLDHGLRVGEVAGLAVRDFDLAAGELRFYRPKVDKIQTHRLTADTLAAARAYLVQQVTDRTLRRRRGRPCGPRARGRALQDAGMTARALTARVRDLGAAVGLVGLSAHDLRHYWATRAARSGTPLDRLQDAGGWASPAMPLRYVEAAKIANQGVLLGESGVARGGQRRLDDLAQADITNDLQMHGPPAAKAISNGTNWSGQDRTDRWLRERNAVAPSRRGRRADSSNCRTAA